MDILACQKLATYMFVLFFVVFGEYTSRAFQNIKKNRHFQKNNNKIFSEIVDSQGISLRFPMCNNMVVTHSHRKP